MLGLKQKFYQLVINRLDGEKLSSVSYQEQAVDYVKKGIGGFILFGGKKDETKNFIAKLQALAEIPLFIASDVERGVGQQIEGATRFPCQMAVAAATDKNKTDDVNLIRNAIHAIAQEAIDIGINMPLIPVLDVNRNPDNPIICTRAFSDKPEEVAWYGKIYIRLLEDAGLISCAKHFPGHGDTSTDSHIELPVISKSLKEWSDVDLYPFREAVRVGVSSIMIGHLSIPAIDALPATLSKKIITDLLRKELEYEGLILTDALNMSALNELRHVPAQCINAGADILLHPADVDAVIEELHQAVSSGEVEEQMIDAAVKRILKYKSKIHKIRKSQGDCRKHSEFAETISGKSITLVKDRPGLLPIKNAEDIRLVLAGDENMHKVTPLKSFYPLSNPEPEVLVCAIFTNVAAWRGTSGIKEDDIQMIRELMKRSRRSIVISFGSPYVLRHFRDADVLIAAYDTTEQAQLSVIKCLKGSAGFQGRLPVELKY